MFPDLVPYFHNLSWLYLCDYVLYIVSTCKKGEESLETQQNISDEPAIVSYSSMASGSRDAFNNPLPSTELSTEEFIEQLHHSLATIHRTNTCGICCGILIVPENAFDDGFVNNHTITRMPCSHYCHTDCQIRFPLCIFWFCIFCLRERSGRRSLTDWRMLMFYAFSMINLTLAYMFPYVSRAFCSFVFLFLWFWNIWII